MNTDNIQNNNTNTPDGRPESKGCREVLKTLATVPVLGALAYGMYKKKKFDNTQHDISDVFQVSNNQANYLEPQPDGKKLRIGIIGFGIRGKQLMRAAGFAEPAWIDTMKEANKQNKKDTRYQQYLEQDDLNIEITAVCDIFDKYAGDAQLAGANIYREGTGGKLGNVPKRYRTYKELINDPNVDAVIIATPDHWHSTMAMDAARAGKHVFCEKPLSWTVPETYMVRQAVKESGIVFQLGHQGRQTDCYQKASEIIDKGLLGQVNLIEVTTNRNSPNGAWVYDIIDGANPQTIDWEQFEGDPARIREYIDYMTGHGLERYIGPEDRKKFSLERFFRWRCWWDYSTGLSGDLLTHEYDAVNQIMKVGIPHSAVSSGGVYFFKDGRTVPDVLQTAFEFPDNGMTMLYSATLASSRNCGKVFMGHDASMEVSDILSITVDGDSTRYADKIREGVIPADGPFYNYVPGSNSSDALTSPTELYFAKRGLLYTYVNGKRYDTTFLHIREWLECIRQGKTPSCDIDQAFEEAMTAHMGTRAYLEDRTMYWDKDKEEIVRGEFA
ncbi:MAG: Gfo/Idh/MocA family oxidoreductase [Tannerellaceae bacterium]|nr:Gfo/Idh/MocA family oxidoreductase [Tannerellaceae bacterium]MCD8265477.1 Gfo/Idh/MocA family oxidoreductase [Tannerellaceae bacterium]